MSVEDELINRIERLEKAKWYINQEIEEQLKDLKAKLNAYRQIRGK